MKRESYNILIIPQDGAHIRRIRLSRATARTFLGGLLLSLVVAGVTLVGLMGALRSLHERESRLAAVVTFEGEREMMETRIGALKKDIDRMEALAARLEVTTGVEERKGEVAVGPIAEEPLFSDERPLAATLDDLLGRASTLEERIHRIYEVAQDQRALLASTPSIWPTQGWITSDFGYRRSPVSGRHQFHEGVDIASRWGSPVLATADGLVTFAGYRPGYGKTIAVDHGFGIRTVYCHNSALLAKVGNTVTRGAKIASVGRTGRTTGPHLHYEVHVDKIPVDPVKYIVR